MSLASIVLHTNLKNPKSTLLKLTIIYIEYGIEELGSRKAQSLGRLLDANYWLDGHVSGIVQI